MAVADDITRGAHAVERLVRSLPISPRNADDVCTALRLAYAVRELLAENHALRRRVAFLQASHHVPRLYGEPESHHRYFRG